MQKKIYITDYNAICNLGNNIDRIFENAAKGDTDFLTLDNKLIKGKEFYFGKINAELPIIEEENFNLRCNRLLLYLINSMQKSISGLFSKYSTDRIAVVTATTNSGIDEYEQTHNPKHFGIGNPAVFIKNHLGLNNFYECISTACSSGIKTFSTAQKLLNKDICDAVIVAGVDSLAKLPVYGFHSLEVLSDKKSNPFSKNRNGINIGEAAAMFIIEKQGCGICIKGTGETSDAYHAATPDPKGFEAANAIKNALKYANLSPDAIDYINLHGTGTIANDLMEANAIYNIFGGCTEASSTKPLTGHCLGAAAALETALCCHVIKNQTVLPHIYDGEYDFSLPQINLVTKAVKKDINNVLCTSFGFGGTNAAIILGREND